MRHGSTLSKDDIITLIRSTPLWPARDKTTPAETPEQTAARKAQKIFIDLTGAILPDDFNGIDTSRLILTGVKLTDLQVAQIVHTAEPLGRKDGLDRNLAGAIIDTEAYNKIKSMSTSERIAFIESCKPKRPEHTRQKPTLKAGDKSALAASASDLALHKRAGAPTAIFYSDSQTDIADLTASASASSTSASDVTTDKEAPQTTGATVEGAAATSISDTTIDLPSGTWVKSITDKPAGLAASV